MADCKSNASHTLIYNEAVYAAKLLRINQDEVAVDNWLQRIVLDTLVLVFFH